VRPLAPILAALAVPLLAIVAVQQDQRRTEHELASVASDIAGRKVEVHCPGILARLVDAKSNAGTVFFDEQGRPASFTDLDEETWLDPGSLRGREERPGRRARGRAGAARARP
jgi:hypothetical protein